ncbi:MAG: 3-hydroxyacyl-CoA dehydrogenase [Acidobacteria bacterium]|nr:3-hydroxyacyl-CoA dehydrogenase [Acidobacteriota bacterium]MBI3658415.1 3-hydroxyacyl-CoA dehydrogenase [Acidobacteriota bacterium]
MDVQTIAVIGAGIMGSGIAHVAAIAGFRTVLHDLSPELLSKALSSIQNNMAKSVELGKLKEADMMAALARLACDDKLENVVQEADLVIEAISENMEWKVKLFSRLDHLCGPDTILASNTSALSLTEMAAVTRRPHQFIGLHFFNPVHVMKLIEVVRALETNEATVSAMEAVGKRMGKETVVIKEAPGFVTSRINALLGNEAFYMLETGLASARDIDKALKLGLNHPMGPFEMVDLVGLDTRLSVLTYLHQTLGEKYRPCPLLVKYVKAGRLGRKTGKGVYEYKNP